MKNRIITFSGKQYSGKDTAAKILMEAMPEFRRCAMGDIIKFEYGKLNNWRIWLKDKVQGMTVKLFVQTSGGKKKR